MRKQRDQKSDNTLHKLSKRAIDVLRDSEKLKFEGEHKKAVELLEKLLVEDPSCIEAVEEIADNLLSLDEFEKAERSAEFALSLDQNSFIANHVLGFLRLHDGKWNEAVDLLQKANEKAPNHPEILRCLGWGLYHNGHIEEGISTLKRALNLYNTNPMILCDLGVCLLQEGDTKESGKLLKRALNIDPHNERVQECLELVQKLEKDFL